MMRLDLEKRLSKTKSKIDFQQDEYFGLLFDMINHTEGLITEKKTYSYWWERLKELQGDIIIHSVLHREQSLDISREMLERAFTPKLKSMLEDRMSDDDK